jgi:SAM-dependent methyltransferase
MADTAELRSRNTEFWAQTAPGWVRHAERHDRLGRPLGEVAIERLHARPGERILDVGCGCGGTSAELARAVAPDGAVVGLDLSSAMVSSARARFPEEAYPGLRFVAGDIETIDVAPGAPFDAAYSRMTLMLLADPVAGFATIRRSLRPGGRLAATVFRDAAANPWLAAAMLGAAPHVGALPPLPVGDEPGPFAFADSGRITRVLTAAGLGSVGVESYDAAMDAPDEPDVVTEWLIEVGPAGAAYRDSDEAGRAAARAGAARLLQRFRRPGAGYRLPVGGWLVTAVNP